MNNLLNKLKPNPSNPRTISKIAFEKLKKSILEFPEMLEKRPIVYDENHIILGGNMRFKALQELEKKGFEIKDNYFISAENWTETQKRTFVIKDNIELGDWDMEILANEWSDLPLEEWGVNIDLEDWFDKEELIEEEKETTPSIKITLKNCSEQDILIKELEDLKNKYKIDFSISC